MRVHPEATVNKTERVRYTHMYESDGKLISMSYARGTYSACLTKTEEALDSKPEVTVEMSMSLFKWKPFPSQYVEQVYTIIFMFLPGPQQQDTWSSPVPK